MLHSSERSRGNPSKKSKMPRTKLKMPGKKHKKSLKDPNQTYYETNDNNTYTSHFLYLCLKIDLFCSSYKILKN